jgi:hypothetical protein
VNTGDSNTLLHNFAQSTAVIFLLVIYRNLFTDFVCTLLCIERRKFAFLPCNTAEINSLTQSHFLDFVHRLILTNDVSETGSASIFRKKPPNLAGPVYQVILLPDTPETVNMLRYAPENRSSPRIVTGKWLYKNKN